MDYFKSLGISVTVVFFLLAMVIVGPHITIWAINKLFGLGIGHSFVEWFAVMWVSMVVSGSSVRYPTGK